MVALAPIVFVVLSPLVGSALAFTLIAFALMVKSGVAVPKASIVAVVTALTTTCLFSGLLGVPLPSLWRFWF
jgi:hypothetical protein